MNVKTRLTELQCHYSMTLNILHILREQNHSQIKHSWKHILITKWDYCSLLAMICSHIFLIISSIWQQMHTWEIFHEWNKCCRIVSWLKKTLRLFKEPVLYLSLHCTHAEMVQNVCDTLFAIETIVIRFHWQSDNIGLIKV